MFILGQFLSPTVITRERILIEMPEYTSLTGSPKHSSPEGETLSKSSLLERDQTNKGIGLKIFNKFPKIASLFGGKQIPAESRVITTLAATPGGTIIERATGSDLSLVSPLGALQIAIERINFEAREPSSFKGSVARRLFSKGGKTSEEIEALWNQSAERKVILEVYSLINISLEVGRPITFRDAFIRVYDSRPDDQRAALDNISRALLLRG